MDFPLDAVPDADLAAFIDQMPLYFHRQGLPTVGMTDEDSAVLMQEFLDGADPSELRRRYGEE
jgi:hypothetical protein